MNPSSLTDRSLTDFMARLVTPFTSLLTKSLTKLLTKPSLPRLQNAPLSTPFVTAFFRTLVLTLIIPFTLITPSPLLAQFSLENELNPSQKFMLKWRTRVGHTLPSSTLLFEENQLILGTLATQTHSGQTNDSGIYVIDPKTGQITQKLGDKNTHIEAIGIAYSKRLVYATTLENTLIALTMLGDILWEIPLGAACEHAPVLTDLDMDDIHDVIIGTDDGRLTAYNGKSGTKIWEFQADFKPKFTYPDKRSFQSAPIVMDLTNDGINDVIAGSRNGVLYAINGRNGRIVWQFNTEEKSGIMAAPFGEKNRITIAAGSSEYQLNLKGNLLSKKSIGNHGIEGIERTPMKLDITSILVTNWSTNQNGVWLLNPSWSKPIFHDLGPILITPAVHPILTPDADQFIVFTMNKKMILLNEAGTLVGRFKLPRNVTLSPLIHDIDGNGKLNLLINSDDGYLRCYEIDTPPTPTEWRGLRANSQNTGIKSSPTSESHQTATHQTSILGYIKTSTGEAFSEQKDTQIAPNRIGPVRLGMTLDVLKDTFPDAQFIKTTKLGFQSIDIIQNGDELMSILFPTWKKLTDTDRITMIVTFNPKFKTIEGIGPQTPLNLTTQLYGTPYLILPNKESEFELIQYPNIAASKYWFGAKPGTTRFDPKSTFKKSSKYSPDAKIYFIGIK